MENINNPQTNNINKVFPDIDKEKSKKIIRFQKLIFIPLICLKVIISFIFCEFYLSYASLNKIDTVYMQISVCLIVIIFFYCYYLTVTISPTQTNVNKYFFRSKEIKPLKFNNWKDCPFCNSKKYIRSSHCRSCQKCMLFRDHHCPYTANCIGFNNMQYFINFLFWGMYAIAYYNITCIKFFLKKDNIYLNDGSTMPRFIYICIIIDFIINILMFNGVTFLFFRNILSVYENFTNNEKWNFPNIERHCFCCNIYKYSNIFKINNNWNIGFLSHLYYAIGPTPLHLFFPLPKFKKYSLDENCSLFKKIKNPNNLQQLKYTLKSKNTDTNSLLNQLGSNPNDFIQLSHKYYDGKNII